MASKGLKGVFLKLDFQKAYDRLDWSFLRLVMERRGFDERWCSRIMQLVRSGHTAININGEVGPFFKASRGVKQGDPVSPLLFNLAVEALAGILDKAKLAGHLKRVVSHLVPDGGGVTHLKYADDTMIMVESSFCSVLKKCLDLRLTLIIARWWSLAIRRLSSFGSQITSTVGWRHSPYLTWGCPWLSPGFW